MCLFKLLPLLIYLLASAVACDEIAVECKAAVHSVFAGCPTLIGLLNLTDLDNENGGGIISDISTVLDSSCCDGLKILQAERCLCDDGFVSLIKSGKPVDEFTMSLLTQSIYFECGLEVKYGSDCSPSSNTSLTYTSPSNHQQNQQDFNSDFNQSADTNLRAPAFGLEDLRLEHISSSILPPKKLQRNSAQQENSLEISLNLPQLEEISTSFSPSEQIPQQVPQQQQQVSQSIKNFDSSSEINDTQYEIAKDVSAKYIQIILSNIFNGTMSKVDYHVDDAPKQIVPQEDNNQVNETVGLPVYSKQIYQQGADYGTDTQKGDVTVFYNDFIYPQNAVSDDVNSLQDTPVIVYSKFENSGDNSNNQFYLTSYNSTLSSSTNNHVNNINKNIFNTTHAQLDLPQLSVTVAPEKNISTPSNTILYKHNNYMHAYKDSNNSNNMYAFEDGRVQQGSAESDGQVLKSVDMEVGQLQKLPSFVPAVEQQLVGEGVGFSYGDDTAQYVAWAVDEQQRIFEADEAAELQAQTTQLFEQDVDIPQAEGTWQFRQANKDCQNGVIMEMGFYKDASIVGQCLRQSRNALQDQDFIVVVAPRNPGVLQWLKTEANISLVQFLSDANKVQEIVGRHVAVGQPLNLKGMVSGQATTLQAMEGSFISISKQDQQFFANDIKIETVRYSCDGVILMISDPLPPTPVSPALPYGLDALMTYLINQPQENNYNYNYNNNYQDEAATISMEPQFKLTQESSMLPYVSENGCESGSNVFDLLKVAYPGFAYLASQQGLEEFLKNTHNDVTVFVPGTLGEGIKIEDYIMANKLLSKDISWLGSGTTLSMNSGIQHSIEISEAGQLYVGGSHIVAWDNVGCNGVMHVLEKQFEGISAPSSSSLPPPPPPPPPSPMTIEIGDGMSLISVDHQRTYLSDQEIYALVASMMAAP